MSRTPFSGVWAHSWAQNGPGRENPIWTCFVTATWPFWTKNGVKSAFLVGLRQNKAQKSKTHVKTCLYRSFSVVLKHLALTTAPRLLPEVLGLGCTRGSISWFWPLASSRIDPDPHEKPFHSILCVFSSILGFILPKTDQNCTFYANLVQKMTIFEAFGKFWLKNGVKSAFLVGFRQN